MWVGCFQCLYFPFYSFLAVLTEWLSSHMILVTRNPKINVSPLQGRARALLFPNQREGFPTGLLCTLGGLGNYNFTPCSRYPQITQRAGFQWQGGAQAERQWVLGPPQWGQSARRGVEGPPAATQGRGTLDEMSMTKCIGGSKPFFLCMVCWLG